MRGGFQLFLLVMCLVFPLLPAGAAPTSSHLVIDANGCLLRQCYGFRKIAYPLNSSAPARTANALAISTAPTTTAKSYTERVVYRFRVPRENTYYLWVRTMWGYCWSNSLTIQVSGVPGVFQLGGDNQYNVMHWVCLIREGSDLHGRKAGEPLPLRLQQGIVTLTIISGTRDYHVYIDQFLLTTDPHLHPTESYPSTPDLLTAEKPDHFPLFLDDQPNKLVFKAAAGQRTGPCSMVIRYAVDVNNNIVGNNVLHFHYPRTVCFDLQQGFKYGILGVASYQAPLPHAGVYYLWARICWGQDAENELCCSLLKNPQCNGSNSGWIDGSFSDQRYGALHWVRLNIGSDQHNPYALTLPSGMFELNLFAYEYNVKLTQLLLTADPHFIPFGAYKADAPRP